MSLDIKAIRRRIATGIYGDDWITEAEIRDAFSALEALVAEVERLCDEVERERAAVVAHLRADADARKDEHGDTLTPCWPSIAIRQAADAIERGEHRREEEP